MCLSVRGDQFVVLRVSIPSPSQLTAKQRWLIEQWDSPDPIPSPSPSSKDEDDSEGGGAGGGGGGGDGKGGRRQGRSRKEGQDREDRKDSKDKEGPGPRKEETVNVAAANEEGGGGLLGRAWKKLGEFFSIIDDSQRELGLGLGSQRGRGLSAEAGRSSLQSTFALI